MTTFIRVLDAPVDLKGEMLRIGVSRVRGLPDGASTVPVSASDMNPGSFSQVPGSPFAYWASDAVRRLFSKSKALGSEGRTAKQGLVTADDFRFVRTWWEVASGGSRWFPFAKGGAFSPFYSDLALVVGYSEADQVGIQTVGRYGRGATHYFRPGLTWPLRSQRGFGMRAMPANCIFSHKGPAVFVDGDESTVVLALLSVTASSSFRYLLELQMAFGSYEVGVVQRTPVPFLGGESCQGLADLGRRAWSHKRLLDTTNETSHAFVLPPGTVGYEAVAPQESAGGFFRDAIEREIFELQREIDDRVYALYGIGEEDRAAIEASMKHGSGAETSTGNDESEDGDEGDEQTGATIGSPVLPVLSWLVGVAFGRFDPRLATGERALPKEPEPSDPLPSRAPGMWPAGEEPLSVSPNVMVDDPGHDDDLRAHVASAAAKTGWPDPEDLRGWLAREFFPLHIKMYSKSRRKAPIYWQLATPSASYSVWLYIHAFSTDTLFRAQHDYIAPKVLHEERKLDAMRSEHDGNARASERKALAAQEAFVDELRAFLAEVRLVTPLWTPHLDDGVAVNAAPLWRLFPQHKVWQKDLLAVWQSLCEGGYDWAHMAMHLWPERVVPKCAEDRSLAIAHGLEDVFWIEESNGKWRTRDRPTRPVSELVKERTSLAVKEALKSLIEAPRGAGATRARGARRPGAAATRGEDS